MRFAIVGAGNMGSLYGANLARAGYDVWLVDAWAAHVRAIQESGLRMEGLNGEFVVKPHATTDADRAPSADIAVIAVNGYSTADAAKSAASLLRDDGYAVTLQNGLGNIEILEAALGRDRVVGGLTFHSADWRGPGHVAHTNRGPTYLGELEGGGSERVHALAEALDRAGLGPQVEPDIMRTIWSKFVHNCAINAVCALTGLRPARLQEAAGVEELQAAVAAEAIQLAGARGIVLDDPNPIDTILRYCREKSHRVSMVQHLARGRRTEVDSLNGYVAAESHSLGLAAPYNDAVAKLLRGLEHVTDDKTCRVV
jgi:2-dehydropantoate 2-reductase